MAPFLNHIQPQFPNFSELNFNCFNVLDMRNLQEHVKKKSVSKIALPFPD